MANQTVGTAAVAVTVSADVGNQGQVLLLQNLGSGDLYFGLDNTVTSSNGWKLPANGVLQLALRNTQTLYVIASASGTDLRVLAVG